MKIYTGAIKKSALSHWSDYAGIAASVVCFVHCWALPAIVVLLPGLMTHNELAHPIFGGAAILSTIPLFFKHSFKNLNKWVFWLMLLGNLILLAMLLSHDHLNLISEVLLSTVGGSILIFVHYRHIRTLKKVHTKN